MAKKSSQSLEEGLDRSANKRGLTGKERHRYIGGALYNMGKAKTRNGHSIGAGKAKPPKAVKPPKVHKVSAHKPAAKPVHKPVHVERKPEPPKEKVSLVVKKNGQRYSIYNAKTGALWNGGGAFRTPAKAKAEAKIEQDAYNQGYKRGRI